jgi:uncharacterized membrane protein
MFELFSLANAATFIVWAIGAWIISLAWGNLASAAAQKIMARKVGR